MQRVLLLHIYIKHKYWLYKGYLKNCIISFHNMNMIFFQDNIIESEMQVDVKHHRHFVARRGEVLRHIADEYGGVTVSFPRSGVKSDKVTIKGSKDCVEGAKRRIQEIVSDLVSCLGRFGPWTSQSHLVRCLGRLGPMNRSITPGKVSGKVGAMNRSITPVGLQMSLEIIFTANTLNVGRENFTKYLPRLILYLTKFQDVITSRYVQDLPSCYSLWWCKTLWQYETKKLYI